MTAESAQIPHDAGVWAVIPISGQDPEFRHGNWPVLAGRSLLEYTFEAVRRSGLARWTVVSTDDRRIADEAARSGLLVPSLRPPHMRQASMAKVLYDAAQRIARSDLGTPQWIVRLQVTYPFRPPNLIDDAVATVLSRDLDSAFAAYPEHHTFWYLDETDGPTRLTTDWRQPRDERAPVYRELSGLFSMVHVDVLARDAVLGDRLGIIPVHDLVSTVDIHSAQGMVVARLLAGSLPEAWEGATGFPSGAAE